MQSFLPFAGRRFFSTSFSRFSSLKLAESTQTSSASKPQGLVGSLTLRFATPNETILNDKVVHAITVNSVNGVMGILADHMPTIAQIKPGLVTVHGTSMTDITHRFIVSGGFAIVQSNSQALVTVPEAIPVSDLDLQAAKKGVDDSQAAIAKASDEKAKAEATIQLELFQAIVHAIENQPAK